MTLDEIVQDIHALSEDLQNFERKYGVLSETFYLAYSRGEEPDDEAWVLDWAAWAGTYEIYLQRLEQYRATIEALRGENEIVVTIMKLTARHESIPVPSVV
jgi:hypothetical protein